MRKWSPEPLVPDREVAAEFVPAPRDGTGDDAQVGGDAARRFRSETGFTDARTLMSQLPREERAQLYELVELEVRGDYEERMRGVEETNRVEREKLQAEQAEAADTWRQAFAAEFGREREATHQRLAREAVELALAVATKVVRRVVEIDSAVLARGVETILYKLDAGQQLDVTVNPVDGERLARDEMLCEVLQIREIKVDRRITPGGCRVETDRQEWDATIERQLETLQEVVRETLHAPAVRSSAPADDQESDDEPRLA